MKLTVEVRGHNPTKLAEALHAIEVQIRHLTGEANGTGTDEPAGTSFQWELKRTTRIKPPQRVNFEDGDDAA